MSLKNRTPRDEPLPCAPERPLEERNQGVNDEEDAADYWRSRGRSGPKSAVALDGGVASESGTGRVPAPEAARKPGVPAPAARPRPRKRR